LRLRYKHGRHVSHALDLDGWQRAGASRRRFMLLAPP
jgi:hypothetical protein